MSVPTTAESRKQSASPQVLPQEKSPRDNPNGPPPETDRSEEAKLGPAKMQGDLRLLAWMFSFLRPVVSLVVAACSYLALFVGAEVLALHFVGQAIDQVKAMHLTGAPDMGIWTWLTSPLATDLRWTLLGLLGAVIGLTIFRYKRETSNAKMSMHMVYYIREAVYDKLQRVGFSFHDAISSGQLINRALTDLQNVRGFVQTAVLMTLEIVLVVGGYLILLLSRSNYIALLALAPLPIWLWYIIGFSKRVRPASKELMEQQDKNVSIIAENIAGVHVVKAFAAEKQEIDKYDRNCDSFMQKVFYRIGLFANFQPTIRGIAAASNLSLFLLAGILILRGGMGVGDMLILGTAMTSILMRLQAVALISDQYQNAIVSSRRLQEVLNAISGVPESPKPQPLPRGGAGSIRFENVTFGYEPDKPVLKEITFEVTGGQTVAIVGPTGSGKSTLAALIGRFYDPQKGRVLIDNLDVREISQDSMHTGVGFVFQETMLFSDTVEANIAYGRPDITGGEVEAAARLAQAHEFIENLPQDYDTVIGERGASLSGGQRQRLAIARAIFSNPRVLVLDDATASVDPETEDYIQRGLSLVLEDRTTVIIAHRISTVKRADLILVLQNGRITQSGTHDDLMAQDEGYYRHVADVQSSAHAPPPAEDHPSHMRRMLGMRGMEEPVEAPSDAGQQPEREQGEL